MAAETKSQPKLKLTYFDIEGRALPIRLALAVGGLEFEDARVWGPVWYEMKSKFLFGQVPLLEIDGRAIYQSDAQLRLAGRLTGLYPSDPIDAARVDEVLSALYDAQIALGRTMADVIPDEDELKAAREQAAKGTLLTNVEALEQRLEEHGGTFMVGDSLTVADLAVYRLIRRIKAGALDYLPATLYDHLPLICGLHNRVGAIEAVKQWCDAKERGPWDGRFVPKAAK